MIEALSLVTKQARLNLGTFRGSEIYPESPVCGFVCDEILNILDHPSGLKKIQFEFPQTLHYVLVNLPYKKIYDVQYQQFIFPDLRENLPDLLTFNLRKLVSPEEELKSIGMYHDIALAYASSLKNLHI